MQRQTADSQEGCLPPVASRKAPLQLLHLLTRRLELLQAAINMTLLLHDLLVLPADEVAEGGW